VRERLAADTGLEILPPADAFEAQANRDGLVEASGALKSVAVSLTKIANDLRWMGSGPRAGLAEIFLPELQKGSSIMPGKVNPVIPRWSARCRAQVIGNDAAITVGGLQGSFELNVQIPMMARNLLQSIAAAQLDVPAVRGEVRRRHRGQPRGLRAPRRGLSGDGDGAQPVHRLRPRDGDREGRSGLGPHAARGGLEHGVDAATLDKALDLRAMARGSSEG
jgi:fumarate hydratase class II